MDRKSWWSTFHKVSKSQTQLKQYNKQLNTHTVILRVTKQDNDMQPYHTPFPILNESWLHVRF